MTKFKFVVPVTLKTIVEVELVVNGNTPEDAMSKINNGQISQDEIRKALLNTGNLYKNPELKSVFNNSATIGEDFELGEVTDEDFFGKG